MQQNTVLQRQNIIIMISKTSDYLVYRFTRNNSSNEVKNLP